MVIFVLIYGLCLFNSNPQVTQFSGQELTYTSVLLSRKNVDKNTIDLEVDVQNFHPVKMTHLLRGFQTVVKRYPVTRGMLTYAVLWPTSNLIQQAFDKTRKKFDYKETLRFCALGTFAVAPTVYCWIKIAGRLVKGNTLKHAIFKAYLDQILFAPVGQTQFYIGINLLEGKTWEECVQEWRNKIIPTWKTGLCFWPLIQTINFYLVPEKNRTVLVSVASFAWTIFLSYMHHRESFPTSAQQTTIQGS